MKHPALPLRATTLLLCLLLCLGTLVACGGKGAEEPAAAGSGQPSDDPADRQEPAAPPAAEGGDEAEGQAPDPPSVESATGGDTGSEGGGAEGTGAGDAGSGG